MHFLIKNLHRYQLDLKIKANESLSSYLRNSRIADRASSAGRNHFVTALADFGGIAGENATETLQRTWLKLTAIHTYAKRRYAKTAMYCGVYRVC